MFKFLESYLESSFETKMFGLTVLLYGLTLVVTTLYCYGRLDYVRSYAVSPKSNTELNKKH